MQLDVDFSELYEAVDKMTQNDFNKLKQFRKYKEKINTLKKAYYFRSMEGIRVGLKLKYELAESKLWDKIESLLGGQNG